MRIQPAVSPETTPTRPPAHPPTLPPAPTHGQIRAWAEEWILDGEILARSPATLRERKGVTDRLLWYLEHAALLQCGPTELRRFFAYLQQGHTEPGGRWGNPLMDAPVSRRTQHAYWRVLKALFRWCIEQELLAVSPLARIKAPDVPRHQIQPFSADQLRALITAAKKSRHPRRDEALVLFLFDTGARAAEVCGLTVGSVDFSGRRCTVLGKGSRQRSLPLGRSTTKALWSYHNAEGGAERSTAGFFFTAGQGPLCAEALTTSGLYQLVERLGHAAGITGLRCSPHTFRHAFAIAFLRDDGDAFALKELLGHTTLHTTNKYVALAQADIERQHRQHSPADQLRRQR